MSLDLDWDLLDTALADSLLSSFNTQLASISRPSFVGPISISSFSFGTVPPSIELVDLRDIHRDFLDADDSPNPSHHDNDIDGTEDDEEEDEDGFAWVSRRKLPLDADEQGRDPLDHIQTPAYHALPPHIRYGGPGRGPVSDLFSSLPSLPLHSPRSPWSPSIPSPGLGPGMSPLDPFPLRHLGVNASLGLSTSSLGVGPRLAPVMRNTSYSTESSLPPSPPPPPPHIPDPSPQAGPNPHPNLQLHFRIHWPSNLRLTLTTSLLINYPSPGFLALPIKLSVTGLLFTGELAVAYEGTRRRVHLCILDDLDPYGPLGGARNELVRSESDLSGSAAYSSHSSEEHEHDQYHPDDSSDEEEDHSPDPNNEESYRPPVPPSASKPTPIGHRLLPRINLESEIGSADRHVLRNVGRVERFVQDVLRKTVEEEMVFPNFHTLVLGDS